MVQLSESCALSCAQVVFKAYAVYTASVPSSWELLHDAERSGCVAMVKRVADGDTARDLHAGWSDEMRKAGWVYGRMYEVDGKKHPLLRPYADLAHHEQMQYKVIQQVARTMLEAYGVRVPRRRAR